MSYTLAPEVGEPGEYVELRDHDGDTLAMMYVEDRVVLKIVLYV
jgi:hypothetical protein